MSGSHVIFSVTNAPLSGPPNGSPTLTAVPDVHHTIGAASAGFGTAAVTAAMTEARSSVRRNAMRALQASVEPVHSLGIAPLAAANTSRWATFVSEA